MDSADDTEGQQRRAPPQSWRSNASSNWRVKDDTPRAPPQANSRFSPRSFDQRRDRDGSGRDRDRDHSAPTDSPASSRLYVGNLLYSAQSSDVEQLFTDNGFTVASINMSTDPFTGRNPSYCFVDLESVEEATRAMAELNGRDVLGRAVRINPGVAKKAGYGGTGPRIGGDRRMGERGEGAEPRSTSDSNTSYKPTFDRWSRNDASDHWKGASDDGKRLYVGGLPRMEPQSAVDAEMQKLFEGFEITAVSKIISPHPSKASLPGDHFYLFVDLADGKAADEAVAKLDGLEAPWGSGGKLKVSKARGDSRRVDREQFGRGGGQGQGRDRVRREE